MRFIALVAACVLVGISAFAVNAANIKQKADGSTVWIDSNSKEWGAGSEGLTVEISDVNNATTFYTLSHKPGIISKVCAVLNGVHPDTAGTRFQIFHGTSGDNSMTNISAAVAANRLELSGTTTPDYGCFTPTSAASTRTIAQGDIIGILPDGNAANARSATVLIVIE